MENLPKKIDEIVGRCLPITASQTNSFTQSLTLADGIKNLREIFNLPQIRSCVLEMANTPLGFMTDRGPDAIAAAQKQGKTLVPYTYQQITECTIEALLSGYRLTGSEWGIIAGRFYGCKNGRYRKIIESPGVTGFVFSNTPPIYKTEMRLNYGKPDTVGYAEVQCSAVWKNNGKSDSIGKEGDPLVFKIRVNAGMGDDGIVGKALSKLFGRVLLRLTGRLEPESTDPDLIVIQESPEKPSLKEILYQPVAQPPIQKEVVHTNGGGENPQISTQQDAPPPNDPNSADDTNSLEFVKSCDKLRSKGQRPKRYCDERCSEKCDQYRVQFSGMGLVLCPHGDGQMTLTKCRKFCDCYKDESCEARFPKGNNQ